MKRLFTLAALVLLLITGVRLVWASCNSMSGYQFSRPGFNFYRPSAAEIAAARAQAKAARLEQTKARIGAIADLQAKSQAEIIEKRRNSLEEQFDRAYDMSPEQREKIAKELYERGKASEQRGRQGYDAAKDYYLFAYQMAPGTPVSRLAHDALKRLDVLEGKAPRNPGGPTQTLLTQEELKELQQRLQQAADSDPEADEEIRLLLEQLADFPNEQSQKLVIDRLRSQPGKAYSEALVQAIRLTNGGAQEHARESLVERFRGLTPGMLKSKLKSGDEETQVAAAKAAGTKSAELTLSLIEQLDRNERVSQAARQSLKSLTGQDFGPQPGANTAERFAAKQRWQRWASMQ